MGLMEWLSLGTAAVTGLVAAASTVAFLRGRVISVLERLDSIEKRMEARCQEAEKAVAHAHRRIDTLMLYAKANGRTPPMLDDSH